MSFPGNLLESARLRRAEAGLLLLAILALAPLLLEPLPVGFLQPPVVARTGVATRLAVLMVLAAVIAVTAWLDRNSNPYSARTAVLLAAFAAGLTVLHWYFVDADPDRSAWQRQLYLDVLNHQADAPHVFRPLPYGFTRSLERVTGDERFSTVAYRWFFTCWFLWCYYRFARLFLSQGRALAALAVLLPLYPLSIAHYWGQLTDPLSHTLFAMALIYTVQNRVWLLALTLGLGIVAKETIVLMVPAYWACWGRRGWPAFARAVGLGLVCVVAFLAVRMPLGWRPDFGQINGTAGLMIGTNLGLGEPLHETNVPLYQNYLQPLLFVGVFVPFIAWHWRGMDGRLKAIALTLVPLLLLSNLCFGWMYESRNYVPLLPLLTTMALWRTPSPPAPG
jgi:hypothetical protein